MTVTNATPLTATTTSQPAPTNLDEIPGWFSWIDQQLFTWFLHRQERAETPGDLLELGAYLGKSAVLMGDHVRDDESFTVCDLFDSDPPDTANQTEMRRSYRTLTRDGFERNYLAFHDDLPTIVQAPTSEILDHVAARSCRFVHIDASHLYEHVDGDIEAAHDLLRPDGTLVCDDYREHHTPGVAAAVWHKVVEGALRPICGTPKKLYATWDDPRPIQDDLIDWLRSHDEDCWHQVQSVAGHRLVLVNRQRQKQDNEVKRLQRELDREQRARRTKQQELEAVRGSVSFRVGRAVTAPLRLLAARRRSS
ncbi:MAG TPA: class I SAM-dependent methyltransferase [Streptosporangiaceae bacterium]